MLHKTVLLGSPGASKSTCGLSYPGVEQHVFGSSEETTAMNFIGRKDILKPYKSDWYLCLSEAEREKFVKEDVKDAELAPIIAKGRALNIAKYRRYIYQLKNEFASGKPVMRPNRDGDLVELKTIFLDNGTPFADDFQDYVKIVYQKEFETKEGNFNSIAFSIKYKSEISDFLRMLIDLPCNVVASFHINMTLDEQNAAKANFMTDAAKGIRLPKEWQPMLMGQAKYILAGIFDFAFFLWANEQPGQSTRYLAKLEADDSTVGIAKGRIQPFANPREIEFRKNHMYEDLDGAIRSYLEKGIPAPSKAQAQGGK